MDRGNRNSIDVPAAIISAAFGALAIVHVFSDRTVDQVGAFLIFMAALPWMVPFFQRSFRSVAFLGSKIEFLETEINRQQRIINDLVIFSLSSSLFEILSHIYHRKEYKYDDNDGSRWALRFLREHGYLQYFRSSELDHEQDLSTVLRLTPAGELLVQERERREKAPPQN